MEEMNPNHFVYMFHQAEIEQMRKAHEESYRKDDPTAEVVMVLCGMDYDSFPAVRRCKEQGYRLVDSNAFGFDDEQTGEFLVFSKKIAQVSALLTKGVEITSYG